jgi:hypothetical protein
MSVILEIRPAELARSRKAWCWWTDWRYSSNGRIVGTTEAVSAAVIRFTVYDEDDADDICRTFEVLGASRLAVRRVTS